eukprot:6274843-Pyramimonas_sp.AAC.1
MTAAIGIDVVTAPTVIEIVTVTVTADTLPTAVRIDGMSVTVTVHVVLGESAVPAPHRRK